jgi:acyl-coenzyme A synthetase/AMP-(fatty) acid ligase
MARKKGRRPTSPKKGASPQKKKAYNPQTGKPTGREVGAQETLENLAVHYQAEGLSATETRQQSKQSVAALTSVSGSAKFDTRTFALACVIAAVLAVAGYYALAAIQVPVSEAFSTSAVRLN